MLDVTKFIFSLLTFWGGLVFFSFTHLNTTRIDSYIEDTGYSIKIEECGKREKECKRAKEEGLALEKAKAASVEKGRREVLYIMFSFFFFFFF